MLGIDVRGLVVEVRPRVLPRREVEVLELGELHRGDDPVAVCGTTQVPVVHADQVSVRGQPDVALERLGALVESRHVGTKGVFGILGTGAAMGNHLRPAPDHAVIVLPRLGLTWLIAFTGCV